MERPSSSFCNSKSTSNESVNCDSQKMMQGSGEGWHLSERGNIWKRCGS